MSKNIPNETVRNAFLRQLVAIGGHVVESGPEWRVYSGVNDHSRPVDTVSASLVGALRERGHLVKRAGGGLAPQELVRAASGRFSDQRVAPSETEALHPFVNDAESPLAWLRSRKDRQGRALISAEQYLAGERLRSDYERSCMERRMTTNWAGLGMSNSGGGNMAALISDSAFDARQKVHEALGSVGPELASILLQVCCLAAGVEQAERILDLPVRSGKAVLGIALTGLARHYGYLTDKRQAAVNCWGLDDYRPAILAGAP